MSHLIRSVVVLLATSVLASLSQAAPAPWDPPMSQALKEMGMRKERVVIQFDVDLDGDGKATPAETLYLAELLTLAGAQVSNNAKEVKVDAGMTIVIGTPVLPPLNEEPAVDLVVATERFEAEQR